MVLLCHRHRALPLLPLSLPPRALWSCISMALSFVQLSDFVVPVVIKHEHYLGFIDVADLVASLLSGGTAVAPPEVRRHSRYHPSL